MKPKKKVKTPPLAITPSTPIKTDMDSEELIDKVLATDQPRIYRGSVETSRGILENCRESRIESPNLSDGEGEANLVANIADAGGLALQAEEPLVKRTEEKSLKALQTSRGNTADEDFKNQVERLTEENSAQADNLGRRWKMVKKNLSTQLAGECDQPTPHLKPTSMDISEELEKEDSLTGFTLWEERKISEASAATTTALQLPPNPQANGPAEHYKTEDGPADYYKTEDGKYGCLKCWSSYKYKAALHRHKKYECGVQAQFQCPDCLVKFKQKCNLKTHIALNRCLNRRNKNGNNPAEYYKTEDGKYGCLKCQSSYKHKYNLYRHKKYECGVEAQFECTDCLRKFKLKCQLKAHIATKSCHNPGNENCNGPAEYYKTEDGRYGCLKCRSSYKYKVTLNRHMKYQCGVQARFQCADCLWKFKLKSHLKNHIANKSCPNRQNKNDNAPAEYYKTEDGGYGCLKCRSTYKHESDLNQHTKYECGVQGKFQCTDCLRKFKRKSHLNTHIVNKSCHNRRNKKNQSNGPAEYYKTEDGKYGCLKCGSSFKIKYSLSRHKKYECGVQAKFQCAGCLRKFKHKSDLKTHITFKRCHNPTKDNIN